MKNIKKSIITIALSFLIHLVALFIFTLAFVIIPFPKCAGSWWAFAFTELSFILSFLISVVAAFGKNDLYSFPTLGVGVVYLAVQFVVCLLISIVGAFVDVPWWIPFLLSLLFIGLALIGTVITFISRKTIEKLDETIKVETKTNKLFRISVAGIIDICEDTALKPELEKLGELIRYSDPVSNSETEEIEGKISSKISYLRTIVEEGKTEESLTLIKSITAMVKERNRICKMSK